MPASQGPKRKKPSYNEYWECSLCLERIRSPHRKIHAARVHDTEWYKYQWFPAFEAKALYSCEAEGCYATASSTKGIRIHSSMVHGQKSHKPQAHVFEISEYEYDLDWSDPLCPVIVRAPQGRGVFIYDARKHLAELAESQIEHWSKVRALALNIELSDIDNGRYRDKCREEGITN